MVYVGAHVFYYSFLYYIMLLHINTGPGTAVRLIIHITTVGNTVWTEQTKHPAFIRTLPCF